jgi:hypothetical protein
MSRSDAPTLALFGFDAKGAKALPEQRKPFARVNVPAMPNKTKRENMAKPLVTATTRTIESKDGARALCKPSRGYVEGAILPRRGHAMGGPTSPGNWTTLASGERQDASVEYLSAERRAYAKAHVRGPSRTRRVLNADLDAEPTVEYRQPGGPGLVSK